MEKQQAILIVSYNATIMNKKQPESRCVPFQLEVRQVGTNRCESEHFWRCTVSSKAGEAGHIQRCGCKWNKRATDVRLESQLPARLSMLVELPT